jgi:hypothetical protein
MVGVPLPDVASSQTKAAARKQLGIADKELVLTVVRENPESACPDNAKAVDAICNSIRQSRSDIRILDSHWQPLGFESNGHSGQPAGTEASESPTSSMHAKANALPGVQRDFAEVHSDRHLLRMQLKASDVVIARPLATLCGELLEAAVPSVLLPKKVRDDGHDWFNAQAMQTIGAAVIAPCAALGGSDTLGSDDYDVEVESDEGCSFQSTVEEAAQRAEGAAERRELDEAEASQRYEGGTRGLKMLQTERMLLGLLDDTETLRDMHMKACAHADSDGANAAQIIAQSLVAMAKNPASEDVVVLRRYARDAVLPWIAKAAKEAQAEKAESLPASV